VHNLYSVTNPMFFRPSFLRRAIILLHHHSPKLCWQHTRTRLLPGRGKCQNRENCKISYRYGTFGRYIYWTYSISRNFSTPLSTKSPASNRLQKCTNTQYHVGFNYTTWYLTLTFGTSTEHNPWDALLETNTENTTRSAENEMRSPSQIHKRSREIYC
jgi:hypothetical protein